MGIENDEDRRLSLNERGHISQANARALDLGLRGDFTVEQRRFAIEYFNNSCAICGRQLFDLFGEHRLAMDHWIPISSDKCPGTTVTNMLPMCHGKSGCNSHKGSKHPHEWLKQRYGKRKAEAVIERIEEYFTLVGELFPQNAAAADARIKRALAQERHKLYTLRMTEAEHKRIQAAAEEARQSMNEWILTAIDRRLDYESRPDVKAARDEYNRR